MKNMKKKVVLIVTIIISVLFVANSSIAHSGRTDSNGGHKDNKNKSGLGSYHYHCGGHPAHLHTNGVCPYSTTKTESTTKSSVPATTTQHQVKEEVKEHKITEATSIQIETKIKELEVGNIKMLTATIYPSNTDNKEINWKSSNEEIASITKEGKIVAEKPGNVIITATTNNKKTDTINITIKEKQEEKNTINVINNNEEYLIENEEISTGTTKIAAGITGLGLLGGGGYLGYKKMKRS